VLAGEVGAVQRDRNQLGFASEAVLAGVAVIVAAVIVGLLAGLIIHVGGSLAEMQGLTWIP